MPRSAWEPWGVFRKPLDGRVQDNLRRWGTGGLRRFSDERPFTDVIPSERTPRRERAIIDHPSLKPQRFMRQIVRAALPLAQGRVLDPFMGGGSTIAAAEVEAYTSVGVEIDPTYFALANRAIPVLAELYRDTTEDSALELLDEEYGGSRGTNHQRILFERPYYSLHNSFWIVRDRKRQKELRHCRLSGGDDTAVRGDYPACDCGDGATRASSLQWAHRVSRRRIKEIEITITRLCVDTLPSARPRRSAVGAP